MVIIIGGADYVTSGAESIARRFNVSPTVIGLTIVAFGSSMPDFVVGLTSTLRGHSGLAIGDVIGANSFDLLLAVGILALIRPMYIGRTMATGNMLLLAISGVVLFICGDDTLFDNAPTNMIDRSDGLVFLAFFALFCSLTMAISHNGSQVTTDPRKAPREDDLASDARNLVTYKLQSFAMKHVRQTVKGTIILPKPPSLTVPFFYIVGGIAALAVGGNWLVDGASGIAVKAGMSEALVGITIVALGSSLPDLTSSVVAALKNDPGLAFGNIVGASIFNVFFMLGFCGTVKPVDASGVTTIDFITVAGAGILVYAMVMFSRKRKISRTEGAILASLYVAYIVYRVVTIA